MLNDKKYGWPTSRTYPRTLAEAFPKDVEVMEWWHPPEKKRGWGNAVMWTAGIMMWIGLAYWFAKG